MSGPVIPGVRGAVLLLRSLVALSPCVLTSIGQERQVRQQTAVGSHSPVCAGMLTGYYEISPYGWSDLNCGVEFPVACGHWSAFAGYGRLVNRPVLAAPPGGVGAGRHLARSALRGYFNRLWIVTQCKFFRDFSGLSFPVRLMHLGTSCNSRH